MPGAIHRRWRERFENERRPEGFSWSVHRDTLRFAVIADDTMARLELRWPLLIRRDRASGEIWMRCRWPMAFRLVPDLRRHEAQVSRWQFGDDANDVPSPRTLGECFYGRV
jgi:hypothetical protein